MCPSATSRSMTSGGRDVELLWTETLMIAMAHYFASRRFIRLPPEVIDRLVAEGHIELEPRPLFLPSYSIRLILIAAFGGVALYLLFHGRLLEPQALSILGVVFAYLLGIAVRLKSMQGWEDIKALAVVVILAIAATAYLLDYGAWVPRPLQASILGLVLFYFGSR